MGDCRIRILIAKDLLAGNIIFDDSHDEEHQFHAISHIDSADATVRDVYNAVLQPLPWKNQEQSSSSSSYPLVLSIPAQPVHLLPDNVRMWDCTFHPPKDITNDLFAFCETSGPKSKTLFDAGWFPSGTLQVLPRGTLPTTTQNYDDVQYNLPSRQSSTSSSTARAVQSPGSTVRLVRDETFTPSQLLQSVTERHGVETDTNDADAEMKRALDVRRQRRNELHAKEAARHAELEARIQQLGRCSSNNNKSKAVSLQVQRMLIKSRCTGSSTLKVQDRVYLRILLLTEGDDKDDDPREEFRYFSKQDTVARIVAALAKDVRLPQVAELLIRHQTDDNGTTEEPAVFEYRRLPIAMRLYEAISAKLIHQVDSVVIRRFTPPRDEPTTSIHSHENKTLHSDQEIQVLEPDIPEVVESGDPTGVGVSLSAVPAADTMETISAETGVKDRLAKAMAAMDNVSSTRGKKKKKSSASSQVRAMLLKSKAKGDAKRTPKMEDRFFLELVVVNDYDDECTASVSPVFLAKSDPVARILRDCSSVPNDCRVDIFVPEEKGGFRVVQDDSISLQEAETKGLLKCFDRLVLRLFK